MRYGSLMVRLTLAAACGIAAFALMPAAAGAPDPNAWTLSRTPWGDPDFHGVWRYEASIALERPSQFAGRVFLTDAEVAQREQVENDQEAKRLAGQEGPAVGRRSVSESPIRGNEYNSFWQDQGRPRKVYKQTSLISD